MPLSKVLRQLIKVALSIGVLFGAVASFIYGAVSLEKHRAEKLIQLLSDVAPGRTTKSAVQEKLKLGSFSNGNSNACTNDAFSDCDQFEFTNKWLSMFHISPAKYVWVTLDYRNGLVVSKSVQFAEDPRISAVSRQLLRQNEPPSGDSDNPSRRVTVNINSTENAIVKVYDDENVPTDQLKKDWKIDLSCLSRLRACQNPRVILSGAFPQE